MSNRAGTRRCNPDPPARLTTVALMGSVTHPQGRLPPRVYWVRRGLVLGVALLLVFGIGKLVGGTGEDGDSSAVSASNTSARAQKPNGSSVLMGPVAPSQRLRTPAKGPLPAPSGDCRDEEISVFPSVPIARGGAPIVIRLQLTGTQPACTFEVSPESVVVKITSGEDRIWSTQDCPRAVSTAEVVVRSGTPVEVPVTWSGRRSDDECTRQPDWALPGFYHVYAAALGSAPNDVQFEVTRAGTRTVTRRPRPRPSASESATTSPSPRRHRVPGTEADAQADDGAVGPPLGERRA